MEKDYFLTYANSSLQDNPKHLQTFVSEIISWDNDGSETCDDLDGYLDIKTAILFLIEDKEVEFRGVSSGNHNLISFGIDNFLSLAKKIPYLERERLIKESTTVFGKFLSKENPYLDYFVGIYDIAYQMVTGCECDINCCDYGIKKVRWGLFGRSGMLEGPQRLKCHECDQLYFVYILLEIVTGKEYSEIELFEYMLLLCNKSIRIRKEIGLEETGKDKNNMPHVALVTREFVEFPLMIKRNIDYINTYYEPNPFRLALLCSAINSLAEFLLNNDRRKLKYCDECNKFYISKSIRKQRFCSDRCRLAWHNRRRIESGESKEYKRRKRMEGAKESYYG